MKIIQDTREQKPLSFTHQWIDGVLVEKLDVGDYGVRFTDGHTPPIFFERKSIGDLYGTLSGGYKRFKKELKKAHDSNSVLIIIIEGTLTKILKGYEHSKRNPDEIVKQLFTIMIKHHIPFVCCKDRVEMAEYITRFFIAVGEKHEREKK